MPADASEVVLSTVFFFYLRVPVFECDEGDSLNAALAFVFCRHNVMLRGFFLCRMWSRVLWNLLSGYFF